MKYRHNEIISVIDICNTKICCCIARILKNNKLEILGIGYCSCLGIASGVITDMNSVKESVAKAIEIAENQANLQVKKVYVNVCGENIKSSVKKCVVNIGGRIITDNDITKGIKKICAEDKNIVYLHKIPLSFSVDGLIGIQNPIGMIADKLEIDVNVVTSLKAQINNLLLCLSKCHVNAQAIFSSSYSIGILSSSEGCCIVIDFGGSSTVISFFYNGNLCGSEVIKYGGAHITNEIANVFGLKYGEAERLKVLYGLALSTSDFEEFNTHPFCTINDESVELPIVSKTHVNEIILKCIKNLIYEIRERITQSIFGETFCDNIIITGGASNMIGLQDLLSNELGVKVSIKDLNDFIVYSDSEISQSLASTYGLVYAAYESINKNIMNDNHEHEWRWINRSNVTKKIVEWLKKNI